MSEVAPSPEPENHEIDGYSLVETSIAFENVVKLRKKAQDLREDLAAENAEYSPMHEMVPIIGGTKLIAGFIGKVLKNAVTRCRADRLDNKANRITRHFTEGAKQ